MFIFQESERRMAQLRARAPGAQSSLIIDSHSLPIPSLSLPNPEHELEVRLEREKEEKSIGNYFFIYFHIVESPRLDYKY